MFFFFFFDNMQFIKQKKRNKGGESSLQATNKADGRISELKIKKKKKKKKEELEPKANLLTNHTMHTLSCCV